MYPLLMILCLHLLPLRNLLDLKRPGEGLPAGWSVRPVKGQAAPEFQVLEADDGELALRVTGNGTAAWAHHKLVDPIAPGTGRLKWSWRVLKLPDSADLRRKDTDDSALRVYVVFGSPGKLFNKSGRVIFYTWGNREPDGLTLRSFVSDRMQIVRMAGRPEADEQWRQQDVDPFADYRRFWDREPPPITSVGLMQDTDMTHSPAVAEIRRLTWELEPALP